MYYYPQQQQQQYIGNTMPYYMQQQQAQQAMAVQMLKGRPVSSIEEVRAAQIDFDGSLFVFPDIANKKVYTKQINLDGTASLKIYELNESSPNNPIPQTYVTKEEFETVVEKLKILIKEQQEKDKENNSILNSLKNNNVKNEVQGTVLMSETVQPKSVSKPVPAQSSADIF